MLTVDEALATMRAAVTPLPAERVALPDALGRVLAEPLIAMRDHPPFAVSQMDGYALRSADAPGRLRVIGESAAGRGFDGLCAAGTAIRISTGAALPKGADTVVIQEDVTRAGDSIDVPAARPGDYVRPRALDFAAGRILLEKGRRLDGIGLAMAAAAGAAMLDVSRKPRIAILASGDELAEPGSVPGPFQIYDFGTYGVAALIGAWGGAAQRLTLEKDDIGAIAQAAERGLKESDLLVVIGGASVGDHDHARPALMKLGLKLAVEKVSVRPGKPTWFGSAPSGLALGLPGNPASALVCAHLFLRPLMRKLLGAAPEGKVVRARLAQSLPANGPREHYLRARAGADRDGCLTVETFENQDSSMLSVFACANALVRLAAGTPALPRNAMVDVILLDGL